MADPIHALRFAIQLTEAEGYPECAAGLRVALDRLTQPSDLQADLTERAEAYRLFTKDWNECGSCSEAFWRALQSDREAAAAEARRAALEEAAQKACDIALPLQSWRVANLQDGTRLALQCMALPHRLMAAIHALASPAPQEDRAPGDASLRWRRHHPDLPIVAPQEDKR